MPFEVGTWNSSSVTQGVTLIQVYSVVLGLLVLVSLFLSLDEDLLHQFDSPDKLLTAP